MTLQFSTHSANIHCGLRNQKDFPQVGIVALSYCEFPPKVDAAKSWALRTPSASRTMN